MHPIQEKLLNLSNKENIAGLSLRKMAEKIDMPDESAQTIKHHLLQLQKKGFLTIDRVKGVVTRASSKPEWANGLLNTKKSSVFSIPVVGMANCGPAEIFAEQNIQGFLRVSSKLTGRTKPTGLYAVKADGSSMNRAEVDGKKIESGDYVIIDSERNTPVQNDVVLAIIDDKATIKRYIEDKSNNQIVLAADSSYDYEPIYLHSDDDFSISGKVISVIKKPNIK